MTSYSSKPVAVNMAAEKIYDRITDLKALQQRVDSLPDAMKGKVDAIKFGDDCITFGGSPMGDIVLKISERVPGRRVAFQAQNAPVPIILAINIEARGEESSEVGASIDVEIPAMLKPMVGPKLQEAADKLGDMMKNLVTLG